MQGLFQDIRYAVRVLRAPAGFTLIAVVTLALGIGATSAMFSIASAVLFEPLPYPQPERLVRIWEFDRLRDSPREGLSGPDYLDLVARQKVFESLAAFTSFPQTLTQRGGEPERVVVSQVTQGFFGVFGRRPALGRVFSAEEDRPGGARIVVLNAGFWARRFASNPNAVGQTLTIDGVDHTIIGVMAEPLSMPSEESEVWTPVQLDPSAAFARSRHNFGAVARLRPGVTFERAQADLTAIGTQLEAEFPRDNKGRGFASNLLHADSTRRVRTALLVLLGAVGMVLMITCANIASLLLSRAVSRVKEVSIRSALGANSWRVIRQFMVEGVMLSCVAGALGLGVAYVALDALMTVAPIDLPRAGAIRISTRVVALVAGITLLTGTIFGLVPAFQTLREDLQGWLKEQARGSGAGRTSHRLRRVLVIGEIAMSAALLIGAALLIKSFWRLQAVDPGFKPDQVLKVQFQLPAARYPQEFAKFPEWPEVNAFHEQLLDRVHQVPGVRAAGIAMQHPLGSGFTSSYMIVGRPDQGPGTRDEIRIRSVSPGYFATVGVPLMRGRWIDDRDRLGQPKVTLINESAARRIFPGEEPIGQKIHIFGGPHAYTIVGVVGNERFMGLDQDVPPAVYPPIAQVPMTAVSLLVRGDGDPTAFTAAIRQEFRAVDPAIALYGIGSMAAELRQTTAQPRFSSALVGAFAAMAWLLAIIGVHGVLSYSVAQRVQEIGVRMALGAEPRDVLRLVMREGIIVALIGLAAGITLAFASSRVLATMLYAVEPRDTAVFAGVAVTLLATSLLASYLPARRATRVDPIAALRAD